MKHLGEEKIVDSVTVLKCRDSGTIATKTFQVNEKGEVEKESYSSGKHFNYQVKKISNLQWLFELLCELQEQPRQFIIRGRPLDGVGNTVFRRVHGDAAAFEKQGHYWVILDIDKQACPPHFDIVARPEEAVLWIKHLLPLPFKSASCIYKFSSSQNVPRTIGEKLSSYLSVHLVFWCNRPIEDQEWKRFFKKYPGPVDSALFNPVQPHYTAKPIFKNFVDPLPNRIGFFNDLHEIVCVPEVLENEKRKVSIDHTRFEISDLNREQAINSLLQYYEEGNRNRICGAIAATLFRKGWSEQQLAEFIRDLAFAANDDEAETRYLDSFRVCRSIERGEPMQGIPTLKHEIGITNIEDILIFLGAGQNNLQEKVNKLNYSSPAEDIENVIKQLIHMPTIERELHIKNIQERTKCSRASINGFIKSSVKEEKDLCSDPALHIANIVLEKSFDQGRNLIRTRDGNFWIYNGRFWTVTDEDYLKKEIIPFAEEMSDGFNSVSSLLSSVISILKGKTYKEGDPLHLNDNSPMVINCSNGEIWFDEDTETFNFRPHQAESGLRYCLEVKYNPLEKATLFNRALHEVFENSQNSKEMARHFMEFVGYLCMPWREIPIIVLLYGGGSNGKTSLMGIVEKLLGPNSIMSERISNIEQHTFKIGALAGKLMLIDDDVDVGTCLPDGFLKKISEEKTLTGEQKYRNPFEFKCRAVPVLLSNTYPASKDVLMGLQRRMKVIPFNRVFTEKDIKPGLFNDIWRTESSGILNEALQGFVNLKKRGFFAEPEDCIIAKEEWFIQSNVLVEFVKERCVVNSGQKQKISEMYEIFTGYCGEVGVWQPITRKSFKDRLSKLGHESYKSGGYDWVKGINAKDLYAFNKDQSGAIRGIDLIQEEVTRL